MLTLNRNLNRSLSRQGGRLQQNLPEKVLQFGEGKFLRAFADWMIDLANEQGVFGGSIVVVPPRSDRLIPAFKRQENLYTLYLRGYRQGDMIEEKRVITSISRILSPRAQWPGLLTLAESSALKFIISNTTEAGIAYRPEPYREGACPGSFPAKLTALLYHRFRRLKAAPGSGFIILPCELLEQNGDALKAVVRQLAGDWGLPRPFFRWLEGENWFLNTLVDRIVSGVPAASLEEEWERLGYRDDLLNAAEPYHLWAVAAPEEIRAAFPLERAGVNLVWTDDVRPYRARKVRLLNGAHTAAVAAALLSGIETVREAAQDRSLGSFIRGVLFEEIIPSFPEQPPGELQAFAREVLERFQNPFIDHRWSDISVNTVIKYRERLLPSLLGYHRLHGTLPPRLTFSLAALIFLYRGAAAAPAKEDLFSPVDDPAVLEFFAGAWKEAASFARPALGRLAEETLRQESFWGVDLNTVPGLRAAVSRYLETLAIRGVASALAAAGADRE